jgi:murein DD-endopeptidase MepM/ murein hydrolase activator NlpD
MSFGQYYYFDKERCNYIPVEYPLLQRVLLTLSLWLVFGASLAGLAIIVISSIAGSPAEIALKSENSRLLSTLNASNEKLVHMTLKLNEIAEKDNELYRAVLGMDEISMDERQAGQGGSEFMYEVDVINESAAEILRKTEQNVAVLDQRLKFQDRSFEEIKGYINYNKERLKHLPFIKPVNSVITSLYGVRLHPVDNIYRMHKGIDLRAPVGTKIYATGNGRIKYAGMRGSLGNTIYIDHGYGFVTLYAHMSRFAEGMKAGKEVVRGQLIGYSGASGIVAAPHLHYEIFVDGEQVDPLQYMFEDIAPEDYLSVSK